ncbi:WD40 repeat domain-containing protein [Shewanella livingstonensis]|uniref:Serine-threonine kinase receptor-associated protein n=1 Tax=Shewanella livingstonensis TaxID=150120 RepID=A0A3G8LQM8_9GAMM|nr:WD40 repeat domain-containing protein [Shewanella livingstonensis]AZG72083.1 WD40 repeat domain-containing protein [Shewanella livingstonensis]
MIAVAGCNQAVVTKTPDKIQPLVNEPLIDGLLSNDASMAVTLGRSRSLSIWDVATSQLLHQWSDNDFDETNYLVALSGNKQYLATAGKQKISIFNLETGKLDIRWPAQGFNPDASISSLFLSQTGSTILVGMNDGSITVIQRSSMTMSLFKQHSAAVNHLELSNFEQQVLSTGLDGDVHIWAAYSGELISSFSRPQRITSVSFDQANRRLFIADALDNNVIIDTQTSQAISQLDYLERYRYFRQALFINYGKNLITATSKQSIIYWDTSSGKELSHWDITAYNAGTTVFSMVLKPNGKLLTLSSDGALETWSL